MTSQQQRFADELPHAELSVLTLFPQPSVPDPCGHLLSQDLLLVEGGSVVNLMAVWRAHRLDVLMRECWEAGVVLSGVGAGSLCWHLGGPTDSFRDALDPFADGVGLLPFSNGVHDDFDDQPRRTTYRRLVADGTLSPGYASEDGVVRHYVGTELREAVSVRRGARAWWVDRDGARPVPTRYLDPTTTTGWGASPSPGGEGASTTGWLGRDRESAPRLEPRPAQHQRRAPWI